MGMTVLWFSISIALQKVQSNPDKEQLTVRVYHKVPQVASPLEAVHINALSNKSITTTWLFH